MKRPAQKADSRTYGIIPSRAEVQCLRNVGVRAFFDSFAMLVPDRSPKLGTMALGFASASVMFLFLIPSLSTAPDLIREFNRLEDKRVAWQPPSFAERSSPGLAEAQVLERAQAEVAEAEKARAAAEAEKAQAVARANAQIVEAENARNSAHSELAEAKKAQEAALAEADKARAREADEAKALASAKAQIAQANNQIAETKEDQTVARAEAEQARSAAEAEKAEAARSETRLASANDSTYNSAAGLPTEDLDAIIRLYSRKISKNPNNALAWQSRGLAHFHKGDYTQALSDYNHAIALDNDAVVAILGSADAKAAIGDYEGAEKDVRLAISRAKGKTPPADKKNRPTSHRQH